MVVPVLLSLYRVATAGVLPCAASATSKSSESYAITRAYRRYAYDPIRMAEFVYDLAVSACGLCRAASGTVFVFPVAAGSADGKSHLASGFFP